MTDNYEFYPEHPGSHGFFSYAHVSLAQIVKYINANKHIPKVSKKKLWGNFRLPEDGDELFFKDDNGEDISAEHSYILPCQFANYETVNYNMIHHIVNKYFTPTDDILQLVYEIEKKYNIVYENTCCIFFRGLDKKTEITLPTYDKIYNKIDPKHKDMRILLQSDELEFMDYFAPKLCNSFYCKDEIILLSKKKFSRSINHFIKNNHQRQFYVKRFLAIVLIMSKCKVVYGNKGNISLWICLFRNGPIITVDP